MIQDTKITRWQGFNAAGQVITECTGHFASTRTAAPQLLDALTLCKSMIPSLETRLTTKRRDAEAWDLVAELRAKIDAAIAAAKGEA